MKTSNPNFVVTILITYLIYKVTLTTCDHFKFFKFKDTIATIKARKIINSVNDTKFIFAGPAKWEKLSKYKDSCIEDKGKINWAIVEFSEIVPFGSAYNRPSMPHMNTASEDSFFYYFTHGIIPKHLLKIFLTFKPYDKVYLSWRNIILDQSGKDSQYKKYRRN